MPRKLIDATSLPVRDLWLHGVDNGDEYAAYFSPDNAEHCVCCGEVIPEGRQVCPKCEGGGNGV